MKKQINKLVRDNIPSIIEDNGGSCEYRTLSNEEYEKELEKKLLEEANEYIYSKSLEELGDLLEVICAILQNKNFSLQDLVNLKNEKTKINGAFNQKIFLKSVEN